MRQGTEDKTGDYGKRRRRRRRKHRRRNSLLPMVYFLLVMIVIAVLSVRDSIATGKPTEESFHSTGESHILGDNRRDPEESIPGWSGQPEKLTESEPDGAEREGNAEDETPGREEGDAEDETPGREDGDGIDREFDFSQPVPESDSVGDDYFDDAVFIGDSRTEGLLLNTGLTNAIEYTHKGLMVNTVFTKPLINRDGEKVSVMEALKSTSFSKVYIMLGINETGWVYGSMFARKYGEVLDEIKAINPDAIIYVQEILPVTETVSDKSSYVKNSKIREYNELLRDLALEKQVYFIDAAKAVANEEGVLPEDAAPDGIHLNRDYCKRWLDYLKTHTVTAERG